MPSDSEPERPCPACHHPEHDPGSCPDCPRCELHVDEALIWLSGVAREDYDEFICGIEAEAARLALEDVAERVRGLPDGSLANSHGGAVLHGLVSRAAILALLSAKEEGS